MSAFSIAKLNNSAVALFQRGCFEEAILSLTTAINQLVCCMQDQHDESGVRMAETEASCPSYDAIRGMESREVPLHRNQADDVLKQHPTWRPHHAWSGMLLPVTIDQPVATSVEAHTESSMYSRALILSEHYRDTSSEHYMARASVSVLYNLAFLHHWRAVHLGMSAGMFRAVQMYCKILKTFHSRQDNPPDIEIVILAIWNNMGHIYSQLFQIDEARACFERLRNLLAQRTDLHFWIPDRDFEIFILSAVFQGSSLHLAPAA